MSDRRKNKVNRVQDLLNENQEELKNLKKLFSERKTGLLRQKRVSGEKLIIEDLQDTLLKSKKNIYQIKINLSKKKTDKKGMFRTLKNKMGYRNNSNVANQSSFSVSNNAIVISESLNLLRGRISNKKNIKAIEVRHVTQVLLYNIAYLLSIFRRRDNSPSNLSIPEDQIIRTRDLDKISKKLNSLATFFHIETKISDKDIRKYKRDNDSMDDDEDELIRELIRQERFLKLKWSLRNLKEAIDKIVTEVIKLIPGIDEEDILKTANKKLNGSNITKKFRDLYRYDKHKGLWMKGKKKMFFAISVYRLKFPFRLKLSDDASERTRNRKLKGFAEPYNNIDDRDSTIRELLS